MSNDIDTQALLNKFTSNKLKTLEPKYDKQAGYHYPIVEEILGDKSKVSPFLNKLHTAGILERKLFDKVISCPVCASNELSFRYCCPFCESFNIQKSALVEHVKCGYMDIEPKFMEDSKLKCPKCHEELKKQDFDYKKAGVWCNCKNCGKSFDIPVAKQFCRNCHTESTFEEVTISDVYAYTLKENVKSESLSNIFLSTAISEFLIKDGLTVESAASVKGKSGANHTFDLVAYKEPNSKKIVIDLAIAESMVSEQPVIALFAKIFDVSPEKAYLIAMPKVNENAKKMAELYNIRAIEAKNPDEAVASLKEKLRSA